MSEKEARRDALDLAVRESGRRCAERRWPAGGYLRQPGGRRELAGRELARAARQRRRPGIALRRQPQAVRPDVPPPRGLTTSWRRERAWRHAVRAGRLRRAQ